MMEFKWKNISNFATAQSIIFTVSILDCNLLTVHWQTILNRPAPIHCIAVKIINNTFLIVSRFIIIITETSLLLFVLTISRMSNQNRWTYFDVEFLGEGTFLATELLSRADVIWI